MKQVAAIAFAALLLLAILSQAEARPKKGFHTGPYLTIEAGIIQADYDRNLVSNEQSGRDFEPTFGFLFGWNIFDDLSIELQGRYATNLRQGQPGQRQHIASANVYGRWTLILDSLTDFPSLRILPFAKGGGSVRVAVLPGNTNAATDTATQIGWGPSVGAGVAFILKKYFYFGIDLQEDLLLFDDIRQTVNGVPGTLVYRGGFHPSFSAMAIIGVHY